MSSAADPWSIDYFNPPTPHVPAPSPRASAPRLIPEVDRLFRVQRDSLKALNALDELERALGKDARGVLKELRALRVEAENTYRVIRSYLDEFASN